MQQKPFVAVDTERDALEKQELLRVGELLADRGVFGIIWLDEDLTVRRRYGVLTDFVKEGVCVTRSVAPLVGLEADIKQLTGDGAVRVPNVTMINGTQPGPRLNIVVYRLSPERTFLVTFGLAGTDNGLEIELSRQVRARLMAETEMLAKSRALARANAELRMANSDLEQFATIVAHDLKAPMRALGYLAEDIERAAADDDAASVRDKLADLRRQTSRMSSMLTALLDYASAGPAQAPLEHVDTLALVREIVGSLPQGGIVVEIGGDWPEIETLAAPFDLALRNVIENGMKHHDRSQGRIAVRCEDTGDALQITIEDDGPGIAAADRESIFLPFRTIGAAGSGMGLPLAKKMVEAVGGTIVSMSTAGERGACFMIRWPKHVVG